MVCARSRARRRLNSGSPNIRRADILSATSPLSSPGPQLLPARAAALDRTRPRQGSPLRPSHVFKKPSEHHRLHDIGASTRRRSGAGQGGARMPRPSARYCRRATRRARYDAHRSSQMTGLFLPTTWYDMRSRRAQMRGQSNLARRSLLTHSLTNARTVVVCSFD
jgi:hypothetical protein